MIFDLPKATLLAWSNEARIWAGAIAAVAAVVAGIAGYAQIRLQAAVGREKDRAFDAYKSEAAENIALAQERSEVARQATEEIKASNLKLSIELERERSERLKIEDRLRPRALNVAQMETLKDRLGGMDPKPSVIVIYRGGMEPEYYAKSLVEFFRLIGFSASISDGTIWITGAEGFHLIEKGPFAGFKSTFDAANIDYALSDYEDAQENTVTMVVGHKPPKP